MTVASRRVLLCVLPGRGHVAPMLAVAEGLLAAGHRVRVVTGRKYADRFIDVGAEVVLIDPVADFDDTDLDATFPGRSRLRGVALMRHDMRESFVRPIASRWATMQQAMSVEPVDAVVCDPLFMAGIPLAMTRSGKTPKLFVLGFVPLSLPPLAAPGGFHGLRERVMDAAMGWMTGPVQKLAEQITLQLTGRELPMRFINWIELSDAIFQLTCPGFEYPRPAARVPIHFIGPIATSTSSTHPLPEWWADLDTDRPIVHVTQGTITNTDPDELINPTIKALADTDCLVVVSTAGAVLDGPLPENVRVAEFLPWDELLPRCSLMVTNGGYGGVNLALRHATPLLVVGASEDKRLIAQRVSWSGVGIGIPRQHASARAIGRSVRTILDDPAYQRTADRMARQMAATRGVQEIVDAIAA